jgi:hypothetical protein
VNPEQHSGMGDGEEIQQMSIDDLKNEDGSLEVACNCLNVRVLIRRCDDGGGDNEVELDEAANRDGGAVRVVRAASI